MSDLRVTDVQAALRHFQGMGHDLISDPDKMLLDGKEYRTLHNRLDIRTYPTTSYDDPTPLKVYNLSSHIGHGESPVVSWVHSSGNDLGHNIYRNVEFLIPRVSLRDEQHTSHWAHHGDRQMGGYIKDHPSGIWFNPGHKEMSGRAYGSTKLDVDHVTATHDMIERHSKGDVPERGDYIINGDYKNAEPLTGEKFRHFKVGEATNDLTAPLMPRYSSHTPNLIHVVSEDDDSQHTYDIDTEQLLRIN